MMVETEITVCVSVVAGSTKQLFVNNDLNFPDE